MIGVLWRGVWLGRLCSAGVLEATGYFQGKRDRVSALALAVLEATTAATILPRRPQASSDRLVGDEAALKEQGIARPKDFALQFAADRS